jgi:hypothetical protein
MDRKSGQLVPLSKDSLTPEVMIQFIAEEAANLKELHVVAIHKDTNEVIIWSTGNPAGLSIAAVSLQDIAAAAIKGEIVNE